MARAGGRNDPLAAYKFIVTVDRMRIGFLELSGLPPDTRTAETRAGKESSSFRTIPGMRKYSNITLKRGYALDKEGVRNWWKSVAGGNPQRKHGTITLMNEAGKAAAVWEFHGAWPSKLVGPDLNARGNEVAIEEMEICAEGITLQA